MVQAALWLVGSNHFVAAAVLAARAAANKIVAVVATAAAAAGHIIALLREKAAKAQFVSFGPVTHARSHLHAQGIYK